MYLLLYKYLQQQQRKHSEINKQDWFNPLLLCSLLRLSPFSAALICPPLYFFSVPSSLLFFSPLLSSPQLSSPLLCNRYLFFSSLIPDRNKCFSSAPPERLSLSPDNCCGWMVIVSMQEMSCVCVCVSVCVAKLTERNSLSGVCWEIQLNLFPACLHVIKQVFFPFSICELMMMRSGELQHVVDVCFSR